MAWNSYRHLEAYYAIPGSGAVLHTINPRLHVEQLAYIVNHADDKYIAFDIGFLSLAEYISEHCPGVKGFIALCDRNEFPSNSKIPNLLCYEELIDSSSGIFDWPVFDENSASSSIP